MTNEELLELMNAALAARPNITQTMNFNAPIGQQIAHVDKIEAHFDRNMGMSIMQADSVREGSNEDATDDEDPLKNFIFKAKLFDSNDRLSELRRTIAHAIDMAEYNEMFGETNPYIISPEAQNEWYYIMKAIEEAEIAVSRMTVPSFIDQMIDWYPWLFKFGTAEEMAASKRKLAKSISHEKGLWKYGKAKEVTRLKDMWARRQPLGIDSAKVERMYNAAYKGLLLKLLELKQEIEKQQAGG